VRWFSLTSNGFC